MSNIGQSILDAVDILLNKRVNQLDFDKTVRATILSAVDTSIGKYQVRYQDSTFFAFANPSETYKSGDQVYVEIPANDYNKTKLIVGSVSELGTKYLNAVSQQERMTEVGTNILSSTKDEYSFCSYHGDQSLSLLDEGVSFDLTALNTYKNNMKYFLIGGQFRTKLSKEQQIGGGNYGIIVEAEYYSAAYKNQEVQDEDDIVVKTYVLDVNNMQGSPYKFIVNSRQYAIFAIDGDNLKSIKSITAFCKGFPAIDMSMPREQDIFISNLELYFMEPLSDDELSNASLKILTPNGSYFTSENDDTKYLKAELKIKGKPVNFESQSVNFYWFIKDNSVTAEDSSNYSVYGGEGWKCLNKSKTYNGVTEFVPQTSTKKIQLQWVRARYTSFKCVAVFNETTLTAVTKIENRVSGVEISITSSAGTKFYFDTGKTKLTCQISPEKSNLTYFWVKKNPSADFVQINGSSRSIEVEIAQSTSFVVYECTVYSEGRILGSADITLTNGVPENEYTLVINNGTQVFKYDEYGVSPASSSADPADRIIIPTLSFDIYNDQGQLVTPTEDRQKVKMCNIKWVWPDEDYTMLEPKDFELEDDIIVNPTTNGNVWRRVLKDSATLTFGIKNRYDADANDNTIRLEVNFQGHNLVATTLFTFTKEGQLGTNGTKYLSRLIPFDPKFKKIYIENNKIWAYYENIEKTYNPVSGGYDVNDHFTFAEPITNHQLRAQIWNGAEKAIYDSLTNRTEIKANLAWEILDIGVRTSHNAMVTIDGEITPIYGDLLPVSTVVKSIITTSELSESANKYYATYPLDVVKTPHSSIHTIVEGGFNECMYNSDGTRGSFNTKPFYFRAFDENGEMVVDDENLEWTVSWYENKKNAALKGKNKVSIEPPSKYDSENVNNYILVTYHDVNGDYQYLISIYLYLNRYGMSAMNDWDGTSIKLNQTGDQYILAPQIGAGQKEDDNSFTGLTMGKSFGVNGNTKSTEIGLMAFSKGERSIFLDAKTGAAYFGTAGSAQLQIIPNGAAIIQSGDYESGQSGMQINFSSTVYKGELGPYIKYGNNKFHVYESGAIRSTLGHIGGWTISDTFLRSDDKDTTLYSTDDVKDGKVLDANNNPKIIRIDVNNKFRVYKDGAIKSTAGTIGSIHIVEDALYSGNKSSLTAAARGFYLNKNGDFELSNGNRSKYLTWNGSDLNIRGGSITNESNTAQTVIGQNGTINITRKSDNVKTFIIDVNGNLTAKGVIKADSGQIGTGNNVWHMDTTSSGISRIYSGSRSSLTSSSPGTYLGTDGISIGASGRKFLRYNGSDLVIEGGRITGGSLKIGKTYSLNGESNYMLEVDDDEMWIGEFVVQEYNGRYLIMSYDEATGMSPNPRDSGKLYFWAGYEGGDDYAFRVFGDQSIGTSDHALDRTTHWGGYSYQRAFDYLWDSILDLREQIANIDTGDDDEEEEEE